LSRRTWTSDLRSSGPHLPGRHDLPR
jgi:hypothetical protein